MVKEVPLLLAVCFLRSSVVISIWCQQLALDPCNYDTWFDLLRLEEVVGDTARTREVYERAIAQLPPTLEKRHWKRYIYLWINYALFEEIQAKNVEKCRAVYNKILDVVPHRKFSFAKIWIHYAEFEVPDLIVVMVLQLVWLAFRFDSCSSIPLEEYLEEQLPNAGMKKFSMHILPLN